ncbi:MAG: 2-phosphoglycerate kinase [Candidatus Mcinerneyibacterium aminivorans]|uniref:2-phosphoglycerate kinase n=1 Tax=Candidatus Mcinerneyibacterium aminivorans TaxID=2703815 RepID=A0A5D0MBP6_9BACT|nr:MAG: 2-phosphoglycerate kinase [Candidatus Mcinerneyibacterium aminivorans]
MEEIFVIKNDGKKYPFSRGIMSRSLTRSGISVEGSYDIVRSIKKNLVDRNIKKIESQELVKKISKELQKRGRILEEKYFRVSRQMKYFKKPIFILIGGGSGVGKSTISSAIGHRLGINRVIGTDTIREIMRSILTSNLVPTLHESSFKAGEKIETSLVQDKLIYGFEQQISLVSQGVSSVLKRGIKEGLNMVINGVHIVPGFLNRKIIENKGVVFHYILDVPKTEEHIRNFYSREEDSLRDPNKYIKEIDDIRKLQNYIIRRAKKRKIPVIKNVNFEKTMKTILEDIVDKLEKEL